ncbi:MAG: hypothetical protein KAI83_15685 [Thiomargarita sp.]|nr:hypothetical protein [Thiomargarita sp.]
MKTDPFLPPATEEIRLVDISAFSGTLQDGIEGNYDFSISDVLKEAWQKTDGVKGTFWGAFIIAFIGIPVGIIVIIIAISLLLGMPVEIFQLILYLVQIVLYIVLLPFIVGIIMIAVRRSVELPVRFSIIFDYFGYTIPIVIAFFLTNLLMIIGLMALIIPGIYLLIAYLFTLPLIVEKNLGPWEAMEASRKAVTHHWFKVFFTIIIMHIIVIISAIPLGIGLIWTLPMIFNVHGILYRIMFGVEAAS